MGEIVVPPPQDHPLAATDMCQDFETSDLPGGVINIVTGDQDALTKMLSERAGVDAMWHFGSVDGAKAVERASITNLKRTWFLVELLAVGMTRSRARARNGPVRINGLEAGRAVG